MTVFKIQVPQFSSEGTSIAPLMAYPRAGRPKVMMWPQDIDPNLLRRLRAACKDTGKAYFDCELLHDGGLAVGNRVNDEPW